MAVPWVRRAGGRHAFRHLLAWLCAATCGLQAASLQAADCRLIRGPDKTVARVLDSETLILDDGSRLRLSGALAPRAADVGAPSGQWASEQAAHAALETLTAGQSVSLHYDTTRQDRHGQWLAQVYVGSDTWVQGALLRAGHARVDATRGQRACIDALVGQEAIARAATAGLWAEAAYRVRDARVARDIAAYRGTYQIVTGRVHTVERARDKTRLILGPDRRRDVSLSILSTDREVIGRLGGDLQLLKGRLIEGRGWIGQRLGGFAAPDIDVTLTGHVLVHPEGVTARP
jgi:micrococcal nuclease